METIAQKNNTAIIYDENLVQGDPFLLFDLQQHESNGDIVGFLGSSGRGDTAIVRHSGRDWLVKHYWRGGMAARITDDRYFGVRRDRSRAWMEWRLLQHMRELGLPVPVPLAARVRRARLTYSADLITEHLPGTQTLFYRLLSAPLPAERWWAVGQCIRRFHNYAVCHTDLNANNILLDEGAGIYLIDFDRCGIRGSGGWRQCNLDRLFRSLTKLGERNPGMHFSRADWQELLAGYEAGASC